MSISGKSQQCIKGVPLFCSFGVSEGLKEVSQSPAGIPDFPFPLLGKNVVVMPFCANGYIFISSRFNLAVNLFDSAKDIVLVRLPLATDNFNTSCCDNFLDDPHSSEPLT
jgi:hypothetical protein